MFVLHQMSGLAVGLMQSQGGENTIAMHGCQTLDFNITAKPAAVLVWHILCWATTLISFNAAMFLLQAGTSLTP